MIPAQTEESQGLMPEKRLRSCGIEYNRPTRHEKMMEEASERGFDTLEAGREETWLIGWSDPTGINSRK